MDVCKLDLLVISLSSDRSIIDLTGYNNSSHLRWFTRSGSRVFHDHLPQGVGGLPRLHEGLGLPVRHTLGSHTDALLLTLPVGQETDHEEDWHQHHWPRDQPHQLQGPKGQTLLHRVYKVTTMSYYFTFKCILYKVKCSNQLYIMLYPTSISLNDATKGEFLSTKYIIIIQIIVLLFSQSIIIFSQ